MLPFPVDIDAEEDVEIKEPRQSIRSQLDHKINTSFCALVRQLLTKLNHQKNFNVSDRCK